MLFVGNGNIPPLIYVTNGTAAGMIVDITRRVAQEAGLRVGVQAMDWTRAQEMVLEGTADALLQINRSAEREQLYDFSDPLLESAFMIFRRDDRIDIEDLASLSGRVAGVEAMGYPITLVRKHPEIRVQVIDSWKDGFGLLNAGTIDAVIIDRWVGEYELALNGIKGITVVQQPLETSSSYFAVRKGNTALLDRINAGLRSARADGSMQKILDRWSSKKVIYVSVEATRYYVAGAIAAFAILVLFVVLVIYAGALSRARKSAETLLDQQRQAEQGLRASTATLEAALANMTDAVFIADSRGAITHFNDASLAFCRAGDRAECATTVSDPRRFLDLFFPGGLPVPPGQWVVPRALAGEIGINVEYGQRRRDTGETWTASYNFAPIRDAAGGIAGAVIVGRDVTEQRTMQETLRQSEEKFHLAFANNPAAVSLSLLEDGRIIDVNDTWVGLTGYGREESIGRSTRSTLWPSQADAQRFVQELREKGSLHRWEQQYRKKSGELFTTQLSAQVLGVQDGDLILSTFIDISERKAIEEKMLQAQKLESLGILAGGIAHDFNNILQAIIGNAEVAKISDTVPAAPVLKNLDEILRSAHRASDLSRQMLAYSGKGGSQVESFDLGEVIVEMMEMLRMTVSKKATVKYSLADGLPSIRADLSQLRQVVMNLVINASEALGEQTGTIVVRTARIDCDEDCMGSFWSDGRLEAGSYVFLEVIDTGCGMDEATKARIFDPFFSTKFAGRGLGLAAVLGIVRGHAGAIKVRSEVGKGTTFRLLFKASATAPRPVRAAGAAGHDWRGKGTILLVDDEEDVRNVGRLMLRHLGFRVVAAADGLEAVSTLRARGSEIACVVLDLTMPAMDGEETFRRIRGIAPDLPILLSSGYDEQAVIRQWAGKDLAGFIQKPYQLSLLESRLRGVLQG
jgi:two-component system, cell cycle sensor histidine kinase and response regulator CckA